MEENWSIDGNWKRHWFLHNLFHYPDERFPSESFKHVAPSRPFDDDVELPHESVQHQSSKQDSKRKRKENASTTSEMPNSYASSNEVIHEEEIESHDMPTNSKSSSKKTRGPTICPDVPMGNHLRRELKFNERRQPIGPSSVSLSSYMGRIAKEKIPIKHHDWRRVPAETKECCWEAIKQKFDWKGFGMEKDARKFAIRWLGELWRAYKSRLAVDLDNKPNHIEPDTWEIFRNHRLDKISVEKSKKFKERRAKQLELPYTGSREGYARVEDRMKKASSNPSSIKRLDVWFKAHTKKNGEPSSSKVAKIMKTYEELKGSQTSQSSTSIEDNAISVLKVAKIMKTYEELKGSQTPQSSTSIEDNAISVLLGSERSNHVRGLGCVVSSSKEDALTKKFARESKLEGEIASLKEYVMSMEQRFKRQEEMISQLLNGRENGKNQDFTTHVANSSQSRSVTSSNRGRTCKLLRWFGSCKVVAKGIRAIDDPSTAVHSVPLAEGDVWVRVRKVMDPKCRLPRPTLKLKVLEDAMGSLIAWPEQYILIDN